MTVVGENTATMPYETTSSYTIGGLGDFVQKGWQCPVCKRVYAPWMCQCSHCGENTHDVVCATSTSTAKQNNKMCECYTVAYEYDKLGRCMGTKEMEQCSCNGDKSKCNFY